MATRSTIWIENEDKSFEGIYAHWDGYLSHNGRILLNNYNSEEKARELIAKGNISVLDETIDTCRFYDEEGYKSSSDDLTDYHEEYLYLFKDGKWFVSEDAKNFVELTEKLIGEE